MARKLQPRHTDTERPGLGSQLTGMGRTALLVALGAAVQTARSTPALLADLASSGEQFLRTQKPRLPKVGPPAVPDLDGLLRGRLEQVLAGLSVPTQRDLARLSEELQALQQRLDSVVAQSVSPSDAADEYDDSAGADQHSDEGR